MFTIRLSMYTRDGRRRTVETNGKYYLRDAMAVLKANGFEPLDQRDRVFKYEFIKDRVLAKIVKIK